MQGYSKKRRLKLYISKLKQERNFECQNFYFYMKYCHIENANQLMQKNRRVSHGTVERLPHHRRDGQLFVEQKCCALETPIFKTELEY